MNASEGLLSAVLVSPRPRSCLLQLRVKSTRLKHLSIAGNVYLCNEGGGVA